MKLTLPSAYSNMKEGYYFEACNKIVHGSDLGNQMTKKGLCIEAIWYLPGMITHTVALIRDALIIALQTIAALFFGCLALLACTRAENLNKCAIGSLILLLSAFSALAVDALGVLCPPLAYRVNELAYSAFEDMATLNDLY